MVSWSILSKPIIVLELFLTISSCPCPNFTLLPSFPLNKKLHNGLTTFIVNQKCGIERSRCTVLIVIKKVNICSPCGKEIDPWWILLNLKKSCGWTFVMCEWLHNLARMTRSIMDTVHDLSCHIKSRYEKHQ